MARNCTHNRMLCLMVLTFLVACRPAIPAATPAPTALQPTERLAPSPTPRLSMVDVGGYKLQLLCRGHGTPTVVIETLLGDAPVEAGTWQAVVQGVEEHVRICIYDRAGLGQSEPPPVTPRTTQDSANDLYVLLERAGEPGPFILVGHSVGGFIVRQYASQHPAEVAGMVLIDSVHPGQAEVLAAALPPAAPDEPALITALRQGPPPIDASPERLDLVVSSLQVQALGPLGDLPLYVVSRAPDQETPNLPRDVLARLEEAWQSLQVDLAGLSSNSTHVIASYAGHMVQIDEPQLVIDAILQVREEAHQAANARQ